MKLNYRVAVLVLVAGAGLSGCTQTPESTATPDTSKIATVEAVEGTDVSSVTLSEAAAHRLGVRTDVVREAAVRGLQRTVLPYSAVLYDPKGDVYAYENREPLVFVRVPLTVDFVEADLAVLSAGPKVGTKVVTVGAPELLGTEFGVGGE